MLRTDEDHYYSLKKFLRDNWNLSWDFAGFVAVALARDKIRKLAFGRRVYSNGQ